MKFQLINAATTAGPAPMAVDLDSRRVMAAGGQSVTLYDAYTPIVHGEVVLGATEHGPFLGDRCEHCYRYSVGSLADGSPRVGRGQPIPAETLPRMFRALREFWATHAAALTPTD
jgi:hypothetical protein